MFSIVKGIIVGLTVAIPLGPTGCLCLDYGLRRGFWQSVAAGIGAALADTLFALVALMGVSAIAGWIERLQMGLALGGGAFLIYLGVKKMLSPPPQTLQVAEGPGRKAAFATTFLFTLANPMTIIGMTALMATIGLSAGSAPWTIGAFVLGGVYVGAIVWYLFLSGLSTVLRRSLSFRIVAALQRFSGGLILVMGLFLLARGVYLWLA